MKKTPARRPSRADAYASLLSSLLRSGEAFGWREKAVPAESVAVTPEIVAPLPVTPLSGEPVTAAG